MALWGRQHRKPVVLLRQTLHINALFAIRLLLLIAHQQMKLFCYCCNFKLCQYPKRRVAARARARHQSLLLQHQRLRVEISMIPNLPTYGGELSTSGKMHFRKTMSIGGMCRRPGLTSLWRTLPLIYPEEEVHLDPQTSRASSWLQHGWRIVDSQCNVAA